MYTNNTKSNNTQTTFQLRQARGGNMYNHLPEEAEAIVNRIGAPIIGFIDRKVDGKLLAIATGSGLTIWGGAIGGYFIYKNF